VKSDALSASEPISQRPRLLLIDMTRIGDATATGELKASLFAEWPADAILQIHAAEGGSLGVAYSAGQDVLKGDSDALITTLEQRARQFAPDLIVYRPTPRTPLLHRVAVALIDRLQKPLATWIMDDWPSAYAQEDAAAADALERDWRLLLRRSAVSLSISSTMSSAFQKRYGREFVAIANGVNEADWPVKSYGNDGPLTVRYAGSLAENMTLATVVKIAKAIEKLSGNGVDIRFEIKTRDLWRRLAAPNLKGLRRTEMVVADFEPAAYRNWLRGGDVAVIAYNFDDASKTYTRYSLANKLPECLASGAPLLAVGPADVATLAVLERYGAGLRVYSDSVDAVADALARLAASPELRREIGEKGRQIAFSDFSLSAARDTLTRSLRAASTAPARRPYSPIGEIRDAGAHVDETEIIADLLANRRGGDHVMIDVGAHVGTSANYFRQLGWTVHCFEPDPENRVKLEARFRGDDSVSIDPRAISDKAQQGVSFYTSEESTGISGLSAFRDTHEETATVDITTIDAVIRNQNIRNIDFLKIDVEGFDFSVLKGVPWDAIKPDAVECEFEDAKTLPLGHTWRDIADYLVDKGYAVYISEWHPIIRYGIPHDWRRVIAYQERTEIFDDAWGNLLAFKDDPGEAAVSAAFSRLVRRRNNSYEDAVSGSNDNAASSRAGGVSAPGRPFYAAFAERLQTRSPQVFAIARLARRALAAAWRRRMQTAIVVGAFLTLLTIGLLQDDSQRRWLIVGGAGLAAVALGALYIGWWSYHRIRALALETAALRKGLSQKAEKKDINAAAASVQQEIDAFRGQQREETERLARMSNNVAALDERTKALASQLRDEGLARIELGEIIAEIDEGLHSLELDLDAIQGRGADAMDKAVTDE